MSGLFGGSSGGVSGSGGANSAVAAAWGSSGATGGAGGTIGHFHSHDVSHAQKDGLGALEELPKLESEMKEVASWSDLVDRFVESQGEEFADETQTVFSSQDVRLCFAKPFDHAPRNEGSKRTVEKMDRERVDIVNVLRLADELELDEKLALRLWVGATTSRGKIARETGVVFEGEPYEAAVYMFFWKRQEILSILLKLISLRNVEEEPLVHMGRVLTDKMITDGNLASDLISFISSHNKRIQDLLSPQRRGLQGLQLQLESLRNERKCLAEILFLIFHRTLAEERELKALINLIREMSNSCVDNQEVASSNAELEAALEVLSILMLTLGAILDRSADLFNRRTGYTELVPIESNDQEWLESVDAIFHSAAHESQLQRSTSHSSMGSMLGLTAFAGNSSVGLSSTNWKHDGILGCCLFFWGSFLFELKQNDFPNFPVASFDHRSQIFQAAFDHRALVFLRSIVRSPFFVAAENRQAFVGVLNTAIEKLITHLHLSQPLNGFEEDKSFEEILYVRSRLVEQRNVPHQQHGGFLPDRRGITQENRDIPRDTLIPAEKALPDSLEDLLALLQHLHNLSPECAEKFVDDKKESFAFAWFFRDVREKAFDRSVDPSSFYVAFLGFLSSLSGTKFAAEKLLQKLEEPESSPTSWNTAFLAIKHYSDFIRQCQNTQMQSYGTNRIEATPIPEIADEDQIVLCCWLQVLNNAIRDEENAGNFLHFRSAMHFLNDTGLNHIAVLLSFGLKPALKAQLTLTLCFMTQPKIADSSRPNPGYSKTMVRSNSAGPQVEKQDISFNYLWDMLRLSLKPDLDSKETHAHRFPFLRSVLRLILQVFKAKNGALLENEVDAARLTLDFVITEIFLKLDQRKFALEGEKWRVASGCLAIFLHVLQQFTATNSMLDSFEAYTIMTRVLEGAKFFHQLLALINDAGGESGVRGARQQHPSAVKISGGWNSYDGNSQEQSAKGSWFLVTSKRSHSDIGNSTAFQGTPATPNVGFGMLRVKSKSPTPEHPFYDGGMFAMSIVEPVVDGWSGPVPLPSKSHAPNQNQYSLSPSIAFQGAASSTKPFEGDGDIGGYWREYTVKLVIRLFEAVSQREASFLDMIQTRDIVHENRLERLHRLFSHERERLLSIIRFLWYPFSAEMRLNAIRFVFRLSKEAPQGTFVQILHKEAKSLVDGFSKCFASGIPHWYDESDPEATDELSTTQSPPTGGAISTPDKIDMSPNMSADSFDPVVDLAIYEVEARKGMEESLMRLLVESMGNSRGNLAELLLGFDTREGISQAKPDSLDLSRDSPTCLARILNILEDTTGDHRGSREVHALMYELVYKLCSKRYTRLAMFSALNSQRGQFWLQRFKDVVSKRPKTNDLLVLKSISWIMKGVLMDLHITYSAAVPNVTPLDLLPTLFSADSGSNVDQTHLRILEVLELIEWTSEHAIAAQAPASAKAYLSNGEFSMLENATGHSLEMLDMRKIESALVIGKDITERKGISENDIKEVLEWAMKRNKATACLVAKIHLIEAWKDIVQFSVVELRGDIIQCAGQNDENLLKQLCKAISHKMMRSPTMPSQLSEPLASLIVTLIGQLRFGDDIEKLEPSQEEVAVSAAVGNYSMTFCANATESNTRAGQPRTGLSRLSREDHRQLLEGLLGTFKEMRRTWVGTLGEASSTATRASLYTGFLLLVNGSRSLFATMLSSKIGRVPAWISEKVFLSATDHLSIDAEIQELRSRASTTLESLYSADYGAALLELAVPDAISVDKPAARMTALAVIQALLECDQDQRWFSVLKRRGFFRHLLDEVVSRLVSDRIFESAQRDQIYSLSLSVLNTVAKLKDGAATIAASDFLEKLSKSPLLLLCDKNALDAWVSSSQDMMVDENGGSAQEIRHDIVLPFLRLLVSTSTTLKQFQDMNNSFNKTVSRFLKVQRRMVTSSLGFPPTSMSDIEEAILLLAILTNSAKCPAFFRAELGAFSADLDALCFDLIQELCLPRRGEWRVSIQPVSKPDLQRAAELVSAPPDLYPLQNIGIQSNEMVSLFQLDVLSQQRRLLQHALSYSWARKGECFLNETNENVVSNEASKANFDVHIKALILCLDHSSRCLAAVARSSTKTFLDALVDSSSKRDRVGGHAQDDFAGVTWSQRFGYVSWTCSTLLFVLETSLSVLYFKLKEVQGKGPGSTTGSSKLVDKYRRDQKLLVNFYDPSQEKSAIEQLEDVVLSNSASSKFIHLLLRRIREL